MPAEQSALADPDLKPWKTEIKDIVQKGAFFEGKIKQLSERNRAKECALFNSISVRALQMEEECLLAFDDQEDPKIIERLEEIKDKMDKILLKITPYIKRTHELEIEIFGPCDKDIAEQEKRLTDLKQDMARNPMLKAQIKRDFDRQYPHLMVDTRQIII